MTKSYRTEFDAANCKATKAVLIETLRNTCKGRSHSDIQMTSFLPPPAVVALRRGETPSLSMEKAIQHLRLLGHNVTITLDGVELPAGE